MKKIWDKIANLAEHIEQKFKETGYKESYNTHDYNWYNSIYSSIRYRRAHIEIVDNRESHGIYILHSTIFPHFNDRSPIWGFDAICGQNKITGAFHDFSPAGDPSHQMIKWFSAKTSTMKWNKPRDLPLWAKEIFSSNMVAAGNIQEQNELTELTGLVLDSLDYYLEHVGYTQQSGSDYHMAQNRYCHYQKQNPQVVKSMVSMGVPEPVITKFVDEILFPETLNIRL
jgi:hypothetical protein